VNRSGVSERTLRRWVEAYKKGGYDALRPRERKDKGSLRAISEENLNEAIELKKEEPGRSADRILKILEYENKLSKGEVSRSTLNRHFRQKDVTRSDLKVSNVPTGRRFMKKRRNGLWQSDIKYGPYVACDPQNPEKKKRTYLVTILDDATRFPCHSQFYDNQRLPVLEDCLRKAILKCGIPEVLYVDNGGQYISKWLRIACARIRIKHLTTKPYSPESKGKIERFNRTVEEFIREVKLEKPSTVEELNRLYWAWLKEGYIEREHSSLDGKTPSQAFHGDKTPLRFCTPEVLRDSFLWEETRKVDKTGCVTMHHVLYEVGLEFCRKKVDLRYDPFDLSEVEVWYRGEKKKVVGPATIGEFTNRAKPSEPPEEQKAGGSRLLRMFAAQNHKRIKQHLGAIRFRKDGDDKDV